MDKAKINLTELFDVLQFAAEKHFNQRRSGYDPLPYINHLIKVCSVLVTIAQKEDKTLLQAALLHDAMEDGHANFEEIAEKFGESTAEIVRELSDDMALPYEERKNNQILSAKSLSDEAKLIRIADKGCNLQDIFSYPLNWAVDRKMAYLENAIKVVEQIEDVNRSLKEWFYQQVQWARSVADPDSL